MLQNSVNYAHWLQATKRETVLTVKNIRNWIRWHVPRMWYADTWSAKRLSEEKMSTKISPSHCMSAYVLICYLLSLILICYFDQSIPMGLLGTAHIEKLDFHDNDWVMPTCTSICQNKHSYYSVSGVDIPLGWISDCSMEISDFYHVWWSN